MSYLSIPHFNFAGFFQADVSTINNDVRYYDNAKFKEQYQEPSSSGVSPNGGWQPEGTGVFRLLGCSVTGGILGTEVITSSKQDPVVGMSLEVSNKRVAGKLVDLDPQQQAVTEIWGMSLRLSDKRNVAYFDGDYAVAAFLNLWRRQQTTSAPDDQTLAAAYQSVLENVNWSETTVSPLLGAMHRASDDGLLSINFNVFGYGRDPNNPRYTLGRLVGTIGPSSNSEPKHFVLGRQLIPKLANPVTPQFGVNTFQCQVNTTSHDVTADFGNALPIKDASGTLSEVGDLALAVLVKTSVEDGATVGIDDVAVLGALNYRGSDWYEQTAGIQGFDYSGDVWIKENISQRPIVLLKKVDDSSFQVLIQESIEGLYVRADSYVRRLNPGEESDVRLFATRYGAPIAATIATRSYVDGMGGAGTGQKIPDIPVPSVGKPATAISYPESIVCDPYGVATLKIQATSAGPGNPRGYIDGQLYGIDYQLHEPPQPAHYNANIWNFISVLIFDDFPIPKSPTWTEHIQPIMQQYGNLYPIMSHHLVDLGDYDSVVKHVDILKLAFSLPIRDPNHMPVTRDLAAGKREAILKWLDQVGPDGLPLKGLAADAPAAPQISHVESNVPELNLQPLQEAGKTAFILQLEARNRAAQGGYNDD